MNFLAPYYSESQSIKPNFQCVGISAAQGNDFAKLVADDFNPIHDADSKRFCVPGDLLFAIALSKYGIYQNMSFKFQELVKADSALFYPESIAPKTVVFNERDKPVLTVELDGPSMINESQVEQLVRNYVIFSGQNFPHILVPLMKQHNVMFNPARPLVIYESMSLRIDKLDFEDLRIELGDTQLEVNGKRGNARLDFELSCSGDHIGSGTKNLVLSGLRAYDEDAIQRMCDEYQASKELRGQSLVA